MKDRKGYWKCVKCGCVKPFEEEIVCWNCGEGEMVYVKYQEDK